MAAAVQNKKKNGQAAILCRGTMTFGEIQGKVPGGGVRIFARPFGIVFGAVLAIALSVPIRSAAQTVRTPKAKAGQILGTVVDANGDPVGGAKVVLTGPNSSHRKSVATPANGFFKFRHVEPAIPFHIVVNATGFAKWTSPAITLAPGQAKLLGSIQLTVATQHTVVHVTYNPVKVATKQVKIEETQRVFGILPNFLVAYNNDAAPLTTKLKFQLALKVATAPVSFAGVAFMAGVRQAADSPNYVQGWTGYGERFGAIEADSFTDIMFGAAILPSLLHQDPRYFYKRNGTVWSRFRHAVFSPFVCRGDNGNTEPNYSSVGGDLASSALSDLYYPQSNRGVGLVFTNFAIGTAERVIDRVAQQFILDKFTQVGGEDK